MNPLSDQAKFVQDVIRQLPRTSQVRFVESSVGGRLLTYSLGAGLRLDLFRGDPSSIYIDNIRRPGTGEHLRKWNMMPDHLVTPAYKTFLLRLVPKG